MIDSAILQRSEEWYEIRLGKATASRFKDVLASLKSGEESAARRKYRSELVVESLMGRSIERYKSAAMDFGTETEELARTTYTLQTGNIVDEVGFLQHDMLEAGASPDGLVSDDGTIEIKCYELANHILALRSGKMPSEHVAQVQGQLWITDRKWCDFISFAPELPENAQLFIERIYRDEAYITNLESEITKFLTQVEEEIHFVQQYNVRKEVMV